MGAAVRVKRNSPLAAMALLNLPEETASQERSMTRSVILRISRVACVPNRVFPAPARPGSPLAPLSMPSAILVTVISKRACAIVVDNVVRAMRIAVLPVSVPAHHHANSVHQHAAMDTGNNGSSAMTAIL